MNSSGQQNQGSSGNQNANNSLISGGAENATNETNNNGALGLSISSISVRKMIDSKLTPSFKSNCKLRKRYLHFFLSLLYFLLFDLF